MPELPPARHLLRARDAMDARYAEPLTVRELAAIAGASPSHFSREFRRTFGEAPHQYLLTRRLERAASLLRSTDRSVAEVCCMVGWSSIGSFTTSFRRIYGMTPTEYRRRFPPTASVPIPLCYVRAHARRPNRSFREDAPPPPT